MQPAAGATRPVPDICHAAAASARQAIPDLVQGGGPAAPNEARFVTDGRTWAPPMRSKAEKVALRAGDKVCAASPGGGGFGDSLTRDAAALELDLNAGLIDRAAAERDYGAVIAQATPLGGRLRYSVDPAATRARRAALKAARPGQAETDGAACRG